MLMCEKTGLLLPNHFGGRPGRVTTDSIHMVVKLVKDAWRRGEVVLLLCLDVKAAFPSAVVDVLVQECEGPKDASGSQDDKGAVHVRGHL